MKKIIINGGIPLYGSVAVSGSKNAALPIIFSCILTNGVNEIENLPDIGDVKIALKLLCNMGATVDHRENTTIIDTRNMSYTVPDIDAVSSIRASTYLIGSCLSRFGICHILPFGGCNFAKRPIDMHISACRSLGARVEGEIILADKLHGGEISFSKPSVGATVNAILLSVSAEGDTRLRGCAVEPHIDALIDFLTACGGDIRRVGNDIFITGRRLHGGKTKVIGDMIEAGSYLALGLFTGGEVCVKDCPTEDMGAFFTSLRGLGAEVLSKERGVSVCIKNRPRHISVVAEPYPGFPTDLQPIIAPLMSKFLGGSITDTVWPSRFGYLKQLSEFGVSSIYGSGRAEIYQSAVYPCDVEAPDLRGGFACIMCALAAKGRSSVLKADTVLRGYERIEEKLCALGAEVTIQNIN